MKRREFITLVGGAVAAWPLAARAQQPAQIRRVGMLVGYAENDPETQARLTAFRQALDQLGWKEGRAAAEGWYRSAEYQKVISLRLKVLSET
jgi:putative ABC transport system substrate-binding protein